MVNVFDIAVIREHAEEFAHQIESQTGVRLDFDLPSLARLDALLAEWLDMATVYDDVGTSAIESLVRPLTSYVGEVLVRSLAAEWIDLGSVEPQLPILRFSTGQKLDLEESVVAVLGGRARPAFHELAVAMEQASSAYRGYDGGDDEA